MLHNYKRLGNAAVERSIAAFPNVKYHYKLNITLSNEHNFGQFRIKSKYLKFPDGVPL